MRRFKHSFMLMIIGIVVFSVQNAYCRTPAGNEAQKVGITAGAPGGPVEGAILSVDDGRIVVKTINDPEREFITKDAVFTKEIIVSGKGITVGDTVLLIGKPSAGTVVRPVSIKILASKDDTTAEPWSGQSGHRFPPHLMIGTITKVSPVMVTLTSGVTKEVKLRESTKIVKEELINPSDIKEGDKVRIIAPPGGRKGMSGTPRIIILSNDRSPREKESSHPYGNDILLPDIPQQSISPEFIYGVWIGRGLYTNEELDRAFRLAKNLGVRYVKIEFKWDYVEPENNLWQWDNENTIDVYHVIDLAKRYDISIIPYFDVFMPWGKRRYLDRRTGECEGPPSGRGQYEAPDPREYAEYVFAVMDTLIRHGVTVQYIELDNEVSNLNDGYHTRNCFINITARQLKEVENSAYRRIKERYPDVMISSTTFSFPGIVLLRRGEHVNVDEKSKNSFIKAYFEDDPKPEFDFLGVHETLRGSGSPFSTLQKAETKDGMYNLGSYYEAYDMWRKILDGYGYADVPIFNLESAAVFQGRQDVQLLQRVIFARTRSSKDNIIGWVVSQLSGSARFTEGGRRGNVSVGIANLSSGYELREGYYGLYVLLKTLARYPHYEGKVMGELNSRKPWVEKFSDGNGNILYAAFVPYHFSSDAALSISLRIGVDKQVTVTRSDGKNENMVSDKSGNIKAEVTQHPIFIEVRQ